MEPCGQKDVIDNLREDVRELKEQSKSHASEIGSLKEGHAETRVYVKQIFEKIDDMKTLLKGQAESAINAVTKTNSTWSSVLTEAIKQIGIIAAIIAGVKLL
ncbi:MAG: hypothetical protein WC998_06165 [Candidatus Paceibacterota bacterium]|jgi:uncharacterized coiled-coil DUF342 family protein